MRTIYGEQEIMLLEMMCGLVDLSLWDWKARVKLNKFSNQNVAGSSISSVHFINEMATSLMLTASSESCHVYRILSSADY